MRSSFELIIVSFPMPTILKRIGIISDIVDICTEKEIELPLLKGERGLGTSNNS